MDVNEVTFITLERAHKVVPVPCLLMTGWILINHVGRIHHGIIQVLGLKDWVLVCGVLRVALVVPSPKADW
jgi:hypothetical protein